jgi:hypothetical protein
MISFFNDVDVASDADWIPAAQFLATRGFFGSYKALPGDLLFRAVAEVWARAFRDLCHGSLDIDAIARAVYIAEKPADPERITETRFARLMAGNSSNTTDGGDRGSPLTRGDALRILYAALAKRT